MQEKLDALVRTQAMQLFRQQGLHFTMQQVAEPLHISKKTIYTVYPSKEALLLDMVDHAFAEIKQALLPMIEGAIAELMNTYHIDHKGADFLHDQLWMHTHGIASMIATNFCNWDMAKVERMLADSRHAFTQKFEA